MDTSITWLHQLLYEVASSYQWLMRCHTDKLMLLFKDSDALYLLQCTSVPFHVITDNGDKFPEGRFAYALVNSIPFHRLLELSVTNNSLI